MEHFLNGEFNFSSRHSFTIYAVSPQFITYTNFLTSQKLLLHCKTKRSKFKLFVTFQNQRNYLSTFVSWKNSIMIRFVSVLSCPRASHSQVSPSRVVPKQKPIISGEIIRLGRHN